MATIDKLIRNAQSLDLREVVEDAMDATKKELVRSQRDQLLHGLRADGGRIGQYKDKYYAKKKYALNPLAGEGNMDWKLTGELHADIFADVRDNTVVLDSADPKTGALIERLGDPFGLTRDRREVYAQDHLAPEAIGRIQQQILKG